MPSTKDSSESLAKLKSCCKLNMYNVRICGSKTPLEGFSDTYVCVKKEEMGRAGELEYVHRVLISSSGKQTSVYNNVGWVVDGDCAACMRCHSGFGLFQWKHHCRMCGDCVCAGCSPQRVDLVGECDLKESGGSRVCNQCYTDLHFRMAKLYAGGPESISATNPAYQEAPTPAMNKSGMPKSILKQTQVEQQGVSTEVSPVTAMLNNLNGRWDRSDDGISTPGTITTDAGDSIKTTPDSETESRNVKSVKSMGPGSAQSGTTDKYFFTPKNAFGEKENKGGRVITGGAKTQARKVLGDVNLESASNSPNPQPSGDRSLKKSNLAQLKKGNDNKGAENSWFSPLPDTPSTIATAPSPKDASSFSKFVPVPSFVIKGCIDNWNGSMGSSKTIYVNVCKHGSMPSPTAKELRASNVGVSYVVGSIKDMERDGESALTVDVCYHTQVHVWAYADENGQNLSALAEHAVVCVNANHSLSMYISSLPQWTTYYGNVKALEMRVQRGQPEMVL